MPPQTHVVIDIVHIRFRSSSLKKRRKEVRGVVVTKLTRELPLVLGTIPWNVFRDSASRSGSSVIMAGGGKVSSWLLHVAKGR
eukprot:scaffold6781_cov204-Amphora_coffeaeformis.AAC.24